MSTRLQPAHRVKTLCHELAHACLHSEPTDRGLAELEAESVAFIVSAEFDIQSDAWSFGYVASWSGGAGGGSSQNEVPLFIFVRIQLLLIRAIAVRNSRGTMSPAAIMLIPCLRNLLILFL